MNITAERDKLELAVFAGGCFWCMVAPFEKIEGVIDVVAGYTGGHKERPTYEEVCGGDTGHYEAVQITFDPDTVSYGKLLNTFWKNIDPTDPGGQFYDRGESYQTVIFYYTEEQKRKAEESKKALEESGRFDKHIAIKILPICDFFPAEGYHQDYHKKNPEHYMQYRLGSGRQKFIEEHWNES